MSIPKRDFPAFPTDPACFDPKTVAEAERLASGMSLRDYFAAKALQGLFALQANAAYGTQFEPFRWNDSEHVESIAKGSYLLADAMLRAREAS